MIHTELAGVTLKNPTVLASGIMGVSGASVCFAAENGAGAVTMKSIGPEERKGHNCPVIAALDHGNINAVGLSCPGVDAGAAEIESAAQNCSSPVIASIFAFSEHDFPDLTKKVSDAGPDIIEVNISCPNVGAEGGKPFGTDPVMSARITEIVKKNTHIPVFVKLTPNTSDITEIAAAVEKAGADGITAINTVGPGMLINVETAKPVLQNKVGGLSGPPIRPIAVRCIYEIYETVDIPIIGVGGVCCGRDALEFLMAGASAVGIGSAVYTHGIDVFKKVSDELIDLMKKFKYENIEQIKGIAHER